MVRGIRVKVRVRVSAFPVDTYSRSDRQWTKIGPHYHAQSILLKCIYVERCHLMELGLVKHLVITVITFEILL